MATFNQRSDALREYVSPVNVEAYGKVLEGLQKGYDKNVGVLNETEEKLKSIAQNTNLRPEAKEYFYKRMRERKDVLEKNVGNFAFANELDYGMKVLNSAVDDNVAVEMYNSSIPSNIGASYKKIQESKNPELANSVNLEYSMQDYSKFVNSGAPVGTKFQGNANYVPYTDIQKVLQDVQKILPPNTYAEINQFGTFTYMSGGKEVQLGANIERAVDAVISSNAGVSKQIEINAWNQFRGVDDKSIANYFAQYASSKAQQYSQLSNSHKAFEEGEKLGKRVIFKKDATMSDEEATAMEKSSNYYKNQSDGYLSMIDGIKNGTLTRKDIEREIYKGELKHNFGNTFAYIKMKDKKFITDQGAMNIWNEQNKQSQFNATMAYNMQKDEADRVLEMTKAYNKGELTAENMIQQGMNPNVVSSIVSADVKRLPAEEGDTPDIDTEIKNVGETQAQNNKALRGIYSDIQLNYGVGVDIASLSNEDRDSFFNSLEQSLKDGKNKDFEWKDRQGKTYIIKENQQMLDQINKIREIRTENTSLMGYARDLAQSQNVGNIDLTKYKIVETPSTMYVSPTTGAPIQTYKKALVEISTGKEVPFPTDKDGQKEAIYRLRRERGVTFGSEQTNAEIKSQAIKAEVIRMGFARGLKGLPSDVENMKTSEIIALMGKKDGGIPEFSVVYDSKSKKLIVHGDKDWSVSNKVGEVDEGQILSSNILSRTVGEFRQMNEQKFNNEKLGNNIRTQTYNGKLVSNGRIEDPEKYVSIKSVFTQGRVDHVATKQDVEGNIYVGYVIDGKWSPNSVKITSEELYTSEGNERLAEMVSVMERNLKAEASK